jgi:hypothetical protein
LVVHSEKAFGSVRADGAHSLTLDICHRPAGGGGLVAVGQAVTGIRVSSGTRVLQSLSAAFTLPAGSHEVGLCGSSTNAEFWNDNGRGRTTVLTHPIP